ncbi:hypothetical protein [Mobilicoccus caccae]|nr:hypothetical protein [Mobilicoccus caccae]
MSEFTDRTDPLSGQEPAPRQFSDRRPPDPRAAEAWRPLPTIPVAPYDGREESSIQDRPSPWRPGSYPRLPTGPEPTRYPLEPDELPASVRRLKTVIRRLLGLAAVVAGLAVSAFGLLFLGFVGLTDSTTFVLATVGPSLLGVGLYLVLAPDRSARDRGRSG